MHRFVLLLGFFCMRAAMAQQAGAQNPVLLDPSHPSVYLQYDHEAERKPEHPGEGSEGLWLRIHNNTRGAISIPTQSLYLGLKVTPLRLLSGKGVLGIRDGIKIAPLYSVEQQGERGFERLPLMWNGDVSAVSWIASGGTVLMSLPKANLVKGRRIALPFSYEWESERDGIEHEAFFYTRELPPKAGALGFPFIERVHVSRHPISLSSPLPPQVRYHSSWPARSKEMVRPPTAPASLFSTAFPIQRRSLPIL
jgi:hypothetical protein